MDEPSTGLDPASRSNLWNVVKRAKQDRAIILTSNTLSLIILKKKEILYPAMSLTMLDFLFSAHSMEEAEYLCDRLGIFVDGSLQCVGNPKEVTPRQLFVFS